MRQQATQMRQRPLAPATVDGDALLSAEDRAAYAAELRRLADTLNAEADRLDGDVLLTVQEAAVLAGRSDEAVRVWVRQHGIGELDPVAQRYMIRRSRLVAFVLQSQGTLPAGLRAGNLTLLKSKTA
jgi:hypothetical protein